MALSILLNKSKFLLIGAGNVALQKAKVLKENNIEFKTISPEFNEDIFIYLNEYEKKEFHISDIKDFNYIINASGKESITNELIKEKEKRFFLLNVVDKPELCDFYFQALLNYGKLQISISTNGASPIISKILKEKISNLIPKNLDKFLEEIHKKRKEGIIDKKYIKKNTSKFFSKFFFIDCSKNDLDLLTIKAYKTIQNSDILLIDKDLNENIKEIFPESAQIHILNSNEDFFNLDYSKTITRLNIKEYTNELLFLKKQNITNIEII